jgi:hypothetical protein
VAPRGSRSSATLVGSKEARLFTPPLRKLTRATSRGFEVADFARDVLGEPLLPWQEWLLIHALELDRGGGYRFRTVVVLVGRQNGKTHLARVLALWRLYVDGARLVLSVAQSLDIAREAWRAGCDTVSSVPDLALEHERTSRVNGDEHLALTGGRRWKIGAANRSAGRGLSVDLLLMDELREQRGWEAWAALSKTTMARAEGMTFGISNAGDDESVVLNHLRDAALTGEDSHPRHLRVVGPGRVRTGRRGGVGAGVSWPGVDRVRTGHPFVPGDGPPGHLPYRGAVPAGGLPGRRRCPLGCVGGVPRRCGVPGRPTGPRGRRCGRGPGSVPRDAVRGCSGRGRAGAGGGRGAVADHARHGGGSAHVDGPDQATGARLLPRPHGRREGRPGAAGIRAHHGDSGSVPGPGRTGRWTPRAPRWRPDADGPRHGCQALQVADGWRFVRRGQGNVDAAYAAAGAVHLARTLPRARPVSRRVHSAA